MRNEVLPDILKFRFVSVFPPVRIRLNVFGSSITQVFSIVVHLNFRDF